MIATATAPETKKDIAQLFLINEARMGNHILVLSILRDYQNAIDDEEFLANYSTMQEINIARKVLELKDGK